MNRKVILTGGAGYIGSCLAVVLKRSGYLPIVFDDFSTSRPIPIDNETVFEVDLTCEQATRSAFSQVGEAYGVIHLAARALVPESCRSPELYFRNNYLTALNVAQMAAESGIKHLVHSSSCAVYGIPERLPITEQTPLLPISPYGESKKICEQMLNQMAAFRGLKVIHLRYFNPAGSVDGRGEAHDPESHLIPNLVSAALKGSPFTIFGGDYPTEDGTCIRDFIHIEDLVTGHLQALEHLPRSTQVHTAMNLGLGMGCSVKEVVAAASKTLEIKIQTKTEARREGDPPQLVASTELAKKELGWAPKKGIEQMVQDHAQYVRGRGATLQSSSKSTGHW